MIKTNSARYRYHNLYASRQWRALRINQLQNNPLCAFCLSQNLIVSASIVDHVIPHKGNKALFFQPDNLQSLCKLCHDKTKQILEKRGVFIGTDISGAPIDSGSHWYK